MVLLKLDGHQIGAKLRSARGDERWLEQKVGPG